MKDLFQAQRVFAKRRELAIRKGTLGILDLGSSKITCFALEFPKLSSDEVYETTYGNNFKSAPAFRVIGVSSTKSRGIRFGEIWEMDESEKAIRTVISGAQKMAGKVIEDIVVCFSGGRLNSLSLQGTSKVMSREVSAKDISLAISACDFDYLGGDEFILNAMPVNFSLDQKTKLSDPIGQIGEELSVDLHIVTANNTTIQNVINCVTNCYLQVAGLNFAPYLSGLSTLTEDELQLGAICIDIGAGTTGISIFYERQLIYLDSVRIGGWHITSDIMQAFQITEEDAERLKTLHGGVVQTSHDYRELIEIPNKVNSWNDERYSISRSELIGVIRPRVEEILEKVNFKLVDAGLEHLPSQKAILCGGSSQLTGLHELTSAHLNRQVRISRPMRVQGLPQAVGGPEFSAIIGQALQLSSPQDESWDFLTPMDFTGGKRFLSAFHWIRENW
mgnify:CR=1 FL=1